MGDSYIVYIYHMCVCECMHVYVPKVRVRAYIVYINMGFLVKLYGRRGNKNYAVMTRPQVSAREQGPVDGTVGRVG